MAFLLCELMIASGFIQILLHQIRIPKTVQMIEQCARLVIFCNLGFFDFIHVLMMNVTLLASFIISMVFDELNQVSKFIQIVVFISLNLIMIYHNLKKNINSYNMLRANENLMK